MREGLAEAVGKIVGEEISAAAGKFPLFNSNHEGYAVIAEEVDEVQNENQKVIKAINVLWDDVKMNRKTTDVCDTLEKNAINLACEAIQVAAMARKYNASMKHRGEAKEW